MHKRREFIGGGPALQTRKVSAAVWEALHSKGIDAWQALAAARKGRPLCYASDCSGGDAPVFAYQALQSFFAEQGVELPELAHSFKSEHPDNVVIFI